MGACRVRKAASCVRTDTLPSLPKRGAIHAEDEPTYIQHPPPFDFPPTPHMGLLRYRGTSPIRKRPPP